MIPAPIPSGEGCPTGRGGSEVWASGRLTLSYPVTLLREFLEAIYLA